MKIPRSYDEYQFSKRELIQYYSCCGILFFLLGVLFYHHMLMALAASLLSIPCLRFYKKMRIEKRKNELQGQFRDLLYSISVSFSVGRQMTEALQEAEENMRLIYKENSHITLEVKAMVKRLVLSKESEESVLNDFAERSGIDDIRNFIEIYLICRKTGGDLIRVIEKATDMICEKISIEKEIRVITAQKRMESNILVMIPIGVLVLLQFSSQGYIGVLYHAMIGRIIMTLSLAMIGVSYYLSHKITKVEI